MKTTKIEFRKTSKSGTTSFHEITFNCSYSDLVKLFGNPNDNDNYKTTSGFNLIDSKGNFATIYDYKATNLFSESYPSVTEFRNLKSYNWHIGSKDIKTSKELHKFLKSNIK